MMESMLQPKKLVLHKELCLGSFLLNVLIGTVIGFAIEFIPDGYFEPYRRGFYCNDSSIQLPYKFNTVSTSALHAFVFLPPFAGILITEVYRSKYYKELYSWRGFNINQILVNSVKYYAYHLFGIILTLFLTNGTKYAVGELRPIFIDICKPIFDQNYCLNHTYIMNYNCRGNNFNFPIKEARLSFFSGHSSLSSATAIFLVIYLQSRISHKNLAIVLKPLVQLSVISMSLFIGYSRIIDGLHHLHDVIVGFLVGTLIGYITAKYIAGLRMRPDEMRRNEMKLQKVELSSVPPDETTPSYKTSVVRIEPTELRLFD